MQVDGHLGEEFEEEFDPAGTLWLGDREPVAVEVEQIVIGATARPRFVVFGGERLGVG